MFEVFALPAALGHCTGGWGGAGGHFMTWNTIWCYQHFQNATTTAREAKTSLQAVPKKCSPASIDLM
jgi:hypothetical protein